MDLVSQFPSEIAAHSRNILHQAFVNVLERIKIVVKDNYLVIRVRRVEADGCQQVDPGDWVLEASAESTIFIGSFQND